MNHEELLKHFGVVYHVDVYVDSWSDEKIDRFRKRKLQVFLELEDLGDNL